MIELIEKVERIKECRKTPHYKTRMEHYQHVHSQIQHMLLVYRVGVLHYVIASSRSVTARANDLAIVDQLINF